MAHARARLTPFGRLLLISRILEQGWSVPAAAESLGVSRATAYKWLRRYADKGLEGLHDRSSAPIAEECRLFDARLAPQRATEAEASSIMASSDRASASPSLFSVPR